MQRGDPALFPDVRFGIDSCSRRYLACVRVRVRVRVRVSLGRGASRRSLDHALAGNGEQAAPRMDVAGVLAEADGSSSGPPVVLISALTRLPDTPLHVAESVSAAT